MPELDAELDTAALPVLPLTAGVVLPKTRGHPHAGHRRGQGRSRRGHRTATAGCCSSPAIDGRSLASGTVAMVEESGELPNGVVAAILRGLHRAQLGAGVTGTDRVPASG